MLWKSTHLLNFLVHLLLKCFLFSVIMLFLKITFHFAIVIFYLSSIHPSVFKKMSQTGYVLHYQMNLLFVNGKKPPNCTDPYSSLDAGWSFDFQGALIRLVRNTHSEEWWDDICDSIFTPALQWRPGDAQSRPLTVSWRDGQIIKSLKNTSQQMSSL